MKFLDNQKVVKVREDPKYKKLLIILIFLMGFVIANNVYQAHFVPKPEPVVVVKPSVFVSESRFLYFVHDGCYNCHEQTLPELEAATVATGMKFQLVNVTRDPAYEPNYEDASKDLQLGFDWYVIEGNISWVPSVVDTENQFLVTWPESEHLIALFKDNVERDENGVITKIITS